VAIACLVAQGKLPRPEWVVIADTGREKSETWAYTDTYVRPLLQPLGIEIHIAGHELSTVDLYSGNGDLLIPAYTAHGKLPTFCSTEWKRRVVQRFLRSRGIGPSNPTNLWIGISVDEAHRAKPSDTGWITHQWPLLFDHPLRRAECARLVESMGLPTPPRSSCWMCPHHRDDEWRQLKATNPADFNKAVQLDTALRERDSELFLHKSRKPLAIVDLTVESEQHDMFPDCDSGMCWV
jgi:hypothetical protein